MKTILFIGYGEPEPASRYRVAQYYHIIKKNYKKEFRAAYFTIYPQYRSIYFPLSPRDKVEILLRKLYVLFKCIQFDTIFLQRNPVRELSPFYEIVIKYVLGKKIIFDFDDALWCMYKNYDKSIKKIIKISDHVIVGNEYLYNFAIRYNNKVTIINTIIDTEKYKAKVRKYKSSTINICWIGSKPGIEYLLKHEKMFIDIKNKYKKSVNFFIVSNYEPNFIKFHEYKYISWSLKIEDNILNISDIGIMPLINNKFTKGKCGFKIIQYGAYSIVSVATPLEINKKIIRENVNGLLANSIDDWISKLIYLLDNKRELYRMKRKSREIVVKEYSLDAKINTFIDVLSSV